MCKCVTHNYKIKLLCIFIAQILIITIFRVLREEWEKREELERLQEEHILLLEQEREKRKEFEIKQREKENQLLGKIYRIIHY